MIEFVIHESSPIAPDPIHFAVLIPMPSFDVVLEPELVEVRNAVDQAKKEIATRFDFKGTGAQLEPADQGKALTLLADAEFQLAQIRDILLAKCAKRGVDARYFDFTAKPEKIGGDRLKQTVIVKAGIDAETGKRLQQLLKQSKIKVQAVIQGDTVRVNGSKRDELQAAIALIRSEAADWPLSYKNFRS